MSLYDRDEEYELFKRRLRREARQSRPAFCDDLHARLVSALLPKRPEPRRPLPRRSLPERYVAGRGGARQSRRVAWALAAASTAAAIAFGLFLRVPHSPQKDFIALNTPAADTPGASHQTPIATSIQQAPPDCATNESPTKADTAGDLDSMTEDFARSATGIGDWALAVADDNQWAGLDRDAQAALAAVAGPLPFDLTFSLAEE